MKKESSSQAAWALLMEGVSQARIEAHRLQHLISRAQDLVENSPEKESLYQIAGDVIVGLPRRLEKLVRALDRTSLALSKMGEDFLESRLPIDDKTMIEEAVASAAFGGTQTRNSIERIAKRYLEE